MGILRCVSADFVVRKIGAELLQFGGENGVHFALLYGGTPSPVMQDSFSARENMPEEATVQLLMDRIAQRVNSAAREKPEVMRD